VALDGDTTFTLQIHVIEHLSFGDLDSLRELQHSVGQGRFTMIDMRNDTKVSYMIHLVISIFELQSYKK
jgi:hypothetical protein